MILILITDWVTLQFSIRARLVASTNVLKQEARSENVASDGAATATMGDKLDDEQSISNLFADDADNDIVFGEKSMADSLSIVVADKEQKRESSSSTNSSMQASKSISTLFSKMAWNGSCTSFMGAGEELLNFSSSIEDLEGSNDVLALSKKKRGGKRFTPKYKYTPTTLKTNPSPTKNSNDTTRVRKTRMKQAPKLQPLVDDGKATDFDASISIADVLTIDWVRSKKVTPVKFDDLVGHDSTSSESKRKPKRGFERKESCLFESGRNKLRKSTKSSRNLFSTEKEDVAPKCPRRSESPTNEERSLRLRVNDNV